MIDLEPPFRRAKPEDAPALAEFINFAGLVGYLLPDRPEAPEAPDYDTLPAMFVPAQDLENLAPGTWYLNALATCPEFRGRGYGARLLALAERLAKD